MSVSFGAVTTSTNYRALAKRFEITLRDCLSIIGTAVNCRPGDLAIVIRSSAANNGKAVTCLELVSAASLNISPEEGPLWRIDRELEWENELGKFQGSVVPDWALMPIGPAYPTALSKAIASG